MKTKYQAVIFNRNSERVFTASSRDSKDLAKRDADNLSVGLKKGYVAEVCIAVSKTDRSTPFWKRPIGSF